MSEKLVMLETIFLPDWSTTAIICEGGKIYIQLIVGKYFTKEQVRSELGCGFNEEFIKNREDLFDEIESYYIENYK